MSPGPIRREHERLKAQPVANAGMIDRRRGARLDVELGDRAGDDVDPAQHRTERDDGMARFDRAGRRFGQEGREEQEVLRRDEDHPVGAVAEPPPELACCVRTPEAAADDQHIAVEHGVMLG